MPKALEDQSDLTPDDADAVVLATPPVHHAAGAIQLMRRGFHVLVEKPAAATVEDIERMHEATIRAGKQVFVGFQHMLNGINDMNKDFIKKINERGIKYCIVLPGNLSITSNSGFKIARYDKIVRYSKSN